MLVQSLCEIWDTGTLGEFWNVGLICLCPKSGDPRIVGQWRPITLLTTLYKIIAISSSSLTYPTAPG